MTAVKGIGFSTSSKDDPFFELLRGDLDKAAELAVDFVELPLFTMDLIAGGHVLQQQVSRLKKALSVHKIGLTAHGPIAFNLMESSDHVARHLDVGRATIEIAGEIGADHVVLHTGIAHTLEPTRIETAYRFQRDALFTLGDFAASRGVIVAVENVFVVAAGDHTALPSRLAGEIEAIGHPAVRGCLDFSHAAITCKAQGADFLSEAKALARVSRHLHLHDSFGDPGFIRTYSRAERVAYGLGDLHLPLGWGSLPWDTIMSEFVFEPGVIFNLELPSHFVQELNTSVKTMRTLRESYIKNRLSRPIVLQKAQQI